MGARNKADPMARTHRMSLTFDDLRRASKDRTGTNHETCRLVLQACNQQIKSGNEAGKTCLFYSIPEMLPGRPLMPMSQMSAYLRDRLSRAGLHVTPVSIALLYIDWSRPLATLPSSSSERRSTCNKDESTELRRKLLGFRRRAAGWTVK